MQVEWSVNIIWYFPMQYKITYWRSDMPILQSVFRKIASFGFIALPWAEAVGINANLMHRYSLPTRFVSLIALYGLVNVTENSQISNCFCHEQSLWTFYLQLSWIYKTAIPANFMLISTLWYIVSKIARTISPFDTTITWCVLISTSCATASFFL